MISLRRFLVVQILLLWQGGFLFYAAFVVPVGTQLLGKVGQGAITARVTDSLNVLGVIGVAIFALELSLSRDPNRCRTVCRWGMWIVVMVCQCLLLYLHRVLESFMDDDRMYAIEMASFYPVHRAYLWTSTVQWFACVLLTWWTLRGWRAEDQSHTNHRDTETQRIPEKN